MALCYNTIKTAILFWCWLSVTCIFGQAADSLTLARNLLKKDSLDQPATERALEACAFAIKVFREEKNMVDWLGAQRTYALIVAKHKKDPFQALKWMDDAVLQAWKKPETKEEFLQKCYSLMWEARIANRAGDFIKVKMALQEANAIFREHLASEDPDIAEFIYLESGNAYVRLEDYENARLIFEEGIRYSKKPDASYVAKYNDYGSLYLTIDSLPEALSIFRRGLSSEGLPAVEIKLLYLNEAECLARMGKFPEALVANQHASEILLPEDDERYNRCLYGLYENYGIIYAGMAHIGDEEKFAESVKWYQKALAIASNPNQRATNREIAGFKIALAGVLNDWGKHREALDTYQEALHLLLPKFKEQSDQNPPDTILFAEKMLYRALEGKARAFLSLDNPEKALQCYELIPAIETKLLATHAYESSSLRVLNESRKRFDDAITIARHLYEQSGGDRRYAERAFFLSEQARGVLLLQSLARAQTDFQLPAEVRKKEHDLRVKTAWYELEIAREHSDSAKINSARAKQLEQELFTLKQEQEQFKTSLRDSFPGYIRLFKDIHFLTIQEVPALLRPNQSFLSYYLAGNTAHLFFLDVAKGTLTWQAANLPAHFRDSTIQQFVEYLANGKGKGDPASKARDRWFKQTAADLYTLLLGPVLPASPDNPSALVIAPDDVLAFLPFELLLTKPSQDMWPELPFLLHQYSVSYAYSATLLDRQQTNMREHNTADRIPFAGFAPVYDDDRDPQTGVLLYPITGMDEMVDKVQQMLGGKVFKGDKANEPEFGLTAPLCRVLLLAMHGFANENAPALSRLLFGDPKKTGNPDNVLYTNELQITYLPVDLVVLNACYTGFGKLQRGEGVYSLTRALTAAGVPSTVMSIWQLSGASSPVLIEAFFQNIKNGMPKDVALQQAKIELLRNPEYDAVVHPTFWGGLLATGDMSALQF